MKKWDANRRNPMKDERLQKRVRAQLEEGWSPEVIAGKLKDAHGGTVVSHGCDLHFECRWHSLSGYLPLIKKLQAKLTSYDDMRWQLLTCQRLAISCGNGYVHHTNEYRIISFAPSRGSSDWISLYFSLGKCSKIGFDHSEYPPKKGYSMTRTPSKRQKRQAKEIFDLVMTLLQRERAKMLSTA